MICPSCDAFYSRVPEECSTCHTKVALCEPCHGTGQVLVISSEGEDFTSVPKYVTCRDCSGNGLIKMVAPAETSETLTVESDGQDEGQTPST